MARLSDYFNSTTLRGRANVAKVTYGVIALTYIIYRLRRRSSGKDNLNQFGRTPPPMGSTCAPLSKCPQYHSLTPGQEACSPGSESVAGVTTTKIPSQGITINVEHIKPESAKMTSSANDESDLPADVEGIGNVVVTEPAGTNRKPQETATQPKNCPVLPKCPGDRSESSGGLFGFFKPDAPPASQEPPQAPAEEPKSSGIFAFLTPEKTQNDPEHLNTEKPHTDEHASQKDPKRSEAHERLLRFINPEASSTEEHKTSETDPGNEYKGDKESESHADTIFGNIKAQTSEKDKTHEQSHSEASPPESHGGIFGLFKHEKSHEENHQTDEEHSADDNNAHSSKKYHKSENPTTEHNSSEEHKGPESHGGFFGLFQHKEDPNVPETPYEEAVYEEEGEESNEDTTEHPSTDNHTVPKSRGGFFGLFKQETTHTEQHEIPYEKHEGQEAVYEDEDEESKDNTSSTEHHSSEEHHDPETHGGFFGLFKRETHDEEEQQAHEAPFNDDEETEDTTSSAEHHSSEKHHTPESHGGFFGLFKQEIPHDEEPKAHIEPGKKKKHGGNEETHGDEEEQSEDTTTGDHHSTEEHRGPESHGGFFGLFKQETPQDKTEGDEEHKGVFGNEEEDTEDTTSPTDHHSSEEHHDSESHGGFFGLFKHETPHEEEHKTDKTPHEEEPKTSEQPANEEHSESHGGFFGLFKHEETPHEEQHETSEQPANEEHSESHGGFFGLFKHEETPHEESDHSNKEHKAPDERNAPESHNGFFGFFKHETPHDEEHGKHSSENSTETTDEDHTTSEEHTFPNIHGAFFKLFKPEEHSTDENSHAEESNLNEHAQSEEYNTQEGQRQGVAYSRLFGLFKTNNPHNPNEENTPQEDEPDRPSGFFGFFKNDSPGPEKPSTSEQSKASTSHDTESQSKPSTEEYKSTTFFKFFSSQIPAMDDDTPSGSSGSYSTSNNQERSNGKDPENTENPTPVNTNVEVPFISPKKQSKIGEIMSSIGETAKQTGEKIVSAAGSAISSATEAVTGAANKAGSAISSGASTVAKRTAGTASATKASVAKAYSSESKRCTSITTPQSPPPGVDVTDPIALGEARAKKSSCRR